MHLEDGLLSLLTYTVALQVSDSLDRVAREIQDPQVLVLYVMQDIRLILRSTVQCHWQNETRCLLNKPFQDYRYFQVSVHGDLAHTLVKSLRTMCSAVPFRSVQVLGSVLVHVMPR